MVHNTISFLGESHRSKPHYLYCIKLEIQDDNTMLVLTRTILTLTMTNLPAHKQAQAKP